MTGQPGTVLVLSPSAPEAGRTALAAALATLGPVATPDWPPGSADEVLEAPVRAVLEALASPSGQPAVICGLAAGALVALHAAVAAPELVRGLVLCTGARPVGTVVRSVHRAVAGLLPVPTLQRLGGRGAPLIPILDVVRPRDYRDLAARVSVPVLVPYGDRDRVNRRPSELLAKSLPNAATRPLPGAGPGWAWREPERLLQPVRELRERR
ncbi:MAG: alpha/beta fold hydrolase [Friedmanniella sp.]